LKERKIKKKIPKEEIPNSKGGNENSKGRKLA
jgi:hypothetical protein